MNIRCAAKDLLDDINLPGYGDDPDPYEFARGLIDAADEELYSQMRRKARALRGLIPGDIWDVPNQRAAYNALQDRVNDILTVVQMLIDGDQPAPEIKELFSWLYDSLKSIRLEIRPIRSSIIASTR